MSSRIDRGGCGCPLSDREAMDARHIGMRKHAIRRTPMRGHAVCVAGRRNSAHPRAPTYNRVGGRDGFSSAEEQSAKAESEGSRTNCTASCVALDRRDRGDERICTASTRRPARDRGRRLSPSYGFEFTAPSPAAKGLSLRTPHRQRRVSR